MTDLIDFHVHPPVAPFVDGPLKPFRDLDAWQVADVADFYREREAIGVLLGLDTESMTRERPFSSRDVAELVAAAPDVFVGLGSVDPARGAKAVAGIHEAARLGLSGLAFDPVAQGFDPAERSMQHLWDIAAEHELLVLFHTGETNLGRGMPGGGGLRLANGDPRAVDAVAASYPSMPVVIAHSGALWREEAIAVARHKANVWLTLLGASATEHVEMFEAGDMAVDPGRCLFGSGWALADLDEQLKEWAAIDTEHRASVLCENAAGLLGFDSDS